MISFLFCLWWGFFLTYESKLFSSVNYSEIDFHRLILWWIIAHLLRVSQILNYVLHGLHIHTYFFRTYVKFCMQRVSLFNGLNFKSTPFSNIFLNSQYVKLSIQFIKKIQIHLLGHSVTHVYMNFFHMYSLHQWFSCILLVLLENFSINEFWQI